MKTRKSLKYMAPRRSFYQFFFSLLCLAGTAVGLWLFWTDLNQYMGKSSEQGVGYLSYKRNTVQRRFVDRLAWSMLPQQAPVYNGDLIRTADISDATVTFITGDSINLAENSLVAIRFDENTGEAVAELLSGRVNLHSSSGRAVLLAGGRELRPGARSEIEVHGGSEHAEFQTIRGTALISGRGGFLGDIFNLGVGQTVRAGSQGLAVSADAVTVLRPLPNQEFSNGTAFFMWRVNHLPPQTHVRIELASSRHFTDIAHTLDEHDTEVTLASQPVSPGLWWWRFSVVNPEDEGSVSVLREGRINVLAQPSVQVAFEQRRILASVQDLATASSQNPLSVPIAAAPQPVMSVAPLPPVQTPSAAPAPAPVPPAVQSSPAVPEMLSRPAGLHPAPQTLIDGAFLMDNRIISFSWDAVEEADAYLFTLKQGSAITNQVYQPHIEINPLGLLNNGPCVWQVQAISLAPDGSILRNGLVAESSFTVAVPQPQAPQLDNPGVIYDR